MRIRSLLLVFAVLVSSSLAAEAQQAGGSALRGRVVDAQEAVLPGVAIIVTHSRAEPSGRRSPGPMARTLSRGLSRARTESSRNSRASSRFTQDVRLQIGDDGDPRPDARGRDRRRVGDGDRGGAAGRPHVYAGRRKRHPERADRTTLGQPQLHGIRRAVARRPIQSVGIGPGSVNINGQHGSQVIYVIDGGNNNDDMRGGGSGPQARPALESIQEFQVITNQYDAEYGRGSGGIVNAITRQGTNAFRGSAFGFFTGSGITAQDFFTSSRIWTMPDISKQQWGGTIGGPIVRNKTHFFGSFEAVNLDQGLSRVYQSRPDMNFSEIVVLQFLEYPGPRGPSVEFQNTFGSAGCGIFSRSSTEGVGRTSRG